jgi:hypothetical protein
MMMGKCPKQPSKNSTSIEDRVRRNGDILGLTEK